MLTIVAGFAFCTALAALYAVVTVRRAYDTANKAWNSADSAHLAVGRVRQTATDALALAVQANSRAVSLSKSAGRTLDPVE